jgi:peroxiredoxin
MKKFLPILLMLCFSLAGFSQDKPFKLKMKINGMQDSTCYLLNYYGSKMYYNDTAQFNNDGIVIFTKEEMPKGGLYIVYTGGKRLFEVILNNENYIELETDTLDYIGNMSIKKSKENTLFFDYLKFLSEKQRSSMPMRNKLQAKETSKKEKTKINQELAGIGTEITDYRTNVINKNSDLFISVFFKTMNETPTPDFAEIKSDSLKRLMKYEYYKNHYFDDIDFSDDRINNTPLYHNKLEKFFTKIVYPTPDSITKEVDFVIEKSKASDELFKYTTYYLLSYYEKSKIMGMDGVFAHIGLNYYTHDLAYWSDSTQIEKIQEKARKLSPLLIGKKSINLSLLDTSGNKWESLHKVDAKYTVLVFWDPDCGHCIKELPKLSHAVDSIKKTIDVKVFSVSSNHNKEWKTFINKNNIDFINVAVPVEAYSDQNKATQFIIDGHTDLKSLNYNKTYDIFTTPQIYLLDRDKFIIGKKLDSELLIQVLNKEEAIQRK